MGDTWGILRDLGFPHIFSFRGMLGEYLADTWAIFRGLWWETKKATQQGYLGYWEHPIPGITSMPSPVSKSARSISSEASTVT